MANNILFSVYNIKNTQSGNVMACFTDLYEAEKAKNWVNKKTQSDILLIEKREITVDTYYDFDPKNPNQKYYSTADEFINMIKNEIENRKFYKLKTHSNAFVKVQNYWWKLDVNTPINRATVYNYFGGKQSDINLTNKQIVEANDWSDLDWKGTDVYDDSFKTGWLSPEGEFYGCSNEEHLQQSHFVHKKYENELEQLGWIKIRRDLTKTYQITALLSYNIKGELIRPTYKQVEYLKNSEINNFDEIEYLLRYKISKSIDSNDRT